MNKKELEKDLDFYLCGVKKSFGKMNYELALKYLDDTEKIIEKALDKYNRDYE